MRIYSIHSQEKTVDNFFLNDPMLDKYLSTIPDEPQVLGYTAQQRADLNSILHMGKFVDAHWPSQVEVFGEVDSPSRRGRAYSVAGVQ